ncbi:hypothetical protein [Gillisia marina]|nr:hypothetical protein [Gillisia marina]
MNTLEECQLQCEDENDTACIEFCDCIHVEPTSFENCHDTYLNSVENKQ